MPKLMLFTLPTCPKCKVIKQKLSSAGIDFEECQDVGKMQEMSIRSAPALFICPDGSDDKGVIIRNYSEVNAKVNELVRGVTS